jgi:hypothetical protein
MSGKKGLVGLALLALVAFLITATMGAASASASGGNAVAAKKKCKKKHGKKKCKKKGEQPRVVRATLTWAPNDEDSSADDADLDLFAFDANGNRAGNGSDTIPQSTLSADVTGRSGTETFKAAQGRVLSFGVCYTVGGSVHTPFTITYVTSDGVTHTDSQRPGSSTHIDYPGGAPIPSGYCPN